MSDKPSTTPEANGKPDGPAIYRTRGAGQGQRQGSEADQEAEQERRELRGADGALGANVTLSVNGKRVTHKLKSESDIPAAVDALAGKASELT